MGGGWLWGEEIREGKGPAAIGPVWPGTLVIYDFLCISNMFEMLWFSFSISIIWEEYLIYSPVKVFYALPPGEKFENIWHNNVGGAEI